MSGCRHSGLATTRPRNPSHPERPPGMRVARCRPWSGLTVCRRLAAGWGPGARWLRWPRRAGPASGARQRGTALLPVTARTAVRWPSWPWRRADTPCMTGSPARTEGPVGAARPVDLGVSDTADRGGHGCPLGPGCGACAQYPPGRTAGGGTHVVRVADSNRVARRARRREARGHQGRRARDGAGRRDRRSEDALRAALECRRPGSAVLVREGHRRGRAATQ